MEREKFGSRLGFILVSAGCAVGLGNVWKFPYICGMYGGAAFIVLYLVFLVALGLPILICEFSVGRGSQSGMGKAYDKLEPAGSKWHHLKWMSITGSYLLMMFYTMVAGWMLYYAYKSITGSLTGLNKEGIDAAYDAMLDKPVTMIIWTLIVIVLSLIVCALGLKNGIEKVTKVMMSCLIFLMIILAVHSLTLSGSSEGVKFYLVPDFSKAVDAGIGETIFAAMSHAFFTLSIGIGSMEIFGSYLDKKRTITGEAINIVILDTFVALMAGLIIIPACFAYNVAPDAGPSLLFKTLPNVFNNMPYGRVWSTLFFVFMSFAALSTVIAVFENILAVFMDMVGWTRKKAVMLNIVLISVLSVPAILGENVWKGIHLLGAGSKIMDVEDFIVSYNFLPLGSMCFVLFCASKRGWGFDNFVNEADQGSGPKFPKKIRFYMNYILPIIISVIYLKGYYDMFYSKGLSVFIPWMCLAVFLLVLVIWIVLAKHEKDNHKIE